MYIFVYTVLNIVDSQLFELVRAIILEHLDDLDGNDK